MTRGRGKHASVPAWLKLVYTAFVLVLIPVYWLEYGPLNFLWASDIALFVTLVALWAESSLLASMMAVGVLIPELLWCADFLVRLLFGPDAAPTLGTRYMFDADRPLVTRALSLFHLVLPVVLVWLVHRLGYQRRALLYQTLLAWVVLPVTYLLTDPSANTNWVYGFGAEPQTWMPAPVFVGLLMVLFPVGIYVPTHVLLSRLFADRGDPPHDGR